MDLQPSDVKGDAYRLLGGFMKKLALAILTFLPLHAIAALMVEDFTSAAWQSVVGSGKSTTSLNGVTLTSYGGSLTFNGSHSERAGCAGGAASHSLACRGDGIGIGNDEITEGYRQRLEISFSDPVNVRDIHLLDLFGNERTGEIAWIGSGNPFPDLVQTFAPPSGNNGVSGGYWETGFTASNVISITLFSKGDTFSDFAAARIAYATVPEPGSLAMLFAGLLALGFLRRRVS